VSEDVRDRLCWLGAVFVLLVGLSIWIAARPSTGLTIGPNAGGESVVTAVVTGSPGWAAGVRPGMSAAPVMGLDAIRVVVDRVGGATVEVRSYVSAQALLLPALWSSVALLAAALLVRRRVADRSIVARFAAPFALASTAALALVSAAAFGSPESLAVDAVLWPLSVAPLALVALRESPAGRTTGRATIVVIGALVAAIGLTALLFVVPAPASWVRLVRESLVAVALFCPVVVGALARSGDTNEWTPALQPLLRTLGITAVVSTPLVVRLAVSAPTLPMTAIVLALWALTAAVVARYAVAPLARLASRALQQRDLVAAAADVERRRLAADLHDGPLQSLTLLAYRLDAAEDPENAALARDVVTELRAVTSSLRLPVVDDLGAGAALEWLTTQVGRLAGFPIDLEWAEAGRPPPDVEQAVFRVAQEALANAVRHGRPPVRVRYDAHPTGALLTVDDAGSPSFASVRPFDAEHGLGLTGMRERAHSVGASLEVGGSQVGSRVSMMWPAPA
jgi:signal transduction histidine kinase